MKQVNLRSKVANRFLLKYVLVCVSMALSQFVLAQHKNVLHGNDWKLAIQAWTFRNFTFTEALNKVDSCGVKYVEAFPTQEIGGGIDGKMDYNMNASTRQKILDLLHKKGKVLVSYGVVSPKTDNEWVQLFQFAKAMHIQNIVSEPKEEQIPLISRLCDEYEIYVAIHNHPKPSHYWNPDVVLAAIKGSSARMGVCADVGHWIRSGLDPIECLKKLEGHVIEFHMKDLNEKGVRGAHDLPWGTGISNIAAIMQEMKRQNFKGVISIEYEYGWDNNVPMVKASAAYFNKTVKKLFKGNTKTK